MKNLDNQLIIITANKADAKNVFRNVHVCFK